MNLRSNRLMVSMDPPNLGWARTNRFDRTSTVSHIILDGKYTFTTPETLTSKKATTGGMGLMAEFACPEFIDAARGGERYHKVGVGLVERGEEPVHIYNAVGASCQPYDADWSADGEGAILLYSIAPMHMGWAFRVDRRLSLKDNRLTMEAKLTNLGEKHISLGEYNHNFLNLNDRVVGPDYTLTLGYDLAFDKKPEGNLRQNGRIYTLAEVPKEPFFEATNDIGDGQYLWTLTHAQDGLRVSEEVSSKSSRTAIWGTSYVFCCEVYVPLEVAPGQSIAWERAWTFDA